MFCSHDTFVLSFGSPALLHKRSVLQTSFVHTYGPLSPCSHWTDGSTVPIDKVVSFLSGGGDMGGSNAKLIRILRLARLAKLARVLKLGKFLKNVDMDAVNPAAFGVVSLFFKILFTGHLLSCFWFFMTSDTVERDATESDWATDNGIHNETLTVQYATSFYWTIATMMAVGYGDVFASNSTERLYSIFAQLVGAISFGAMIATVNILVASR